MKAKRAGSLIFFLGLTAILAGMLINAYYGFSGSLLLAQGQQSKLDSEADFFKIDNKPPGELKLADFDIRLQKFELVYDNEKTTDYSAVIGIFEDDNWVGEHRLSQKQRLKNQGVSLYIEKYGYSPLFMIKEPGNGRVVAQRIINLNVLTDQQTVRMRLTGGENLTLRFFPDFDKKGKKPETRSTLPKNPVFLVSTDKEEGLLYLQKNLRIENWDLNFNELRYWVLFKVRKEPGEPVIYSGVSLGLVGFGLWLFSTKGRNFPVG